MFNTLLHCNLPHTLIIQKVIYGAQGEKCSCIQRCAFTHGMPSQLATSCAPDGECDAAGDQVDAALLELGLCKSPCCLDDGGSGGRPWGCDGFELLLLPPRDAGWAAAAACSMEVDSERGGGARWATPC